MSVTYCGIRNMTVKEFAANLSRLCDMLEAATLQAAVLVDVSAHDGTFCEVEEQLKRTHVAIKDAAYSAYDVNNSMFYIQSREEVI